MSDQLELRVLSGLHEGARAPVPADGSPIRIGRSASDLILRDLVFESATLVCEGGQWRLAIDDEPAVALGIGEAARLGSLLIQVADARSAWPDLKTLTVSLERSESTEADHAPIINTRSPDAARGSPDQAGDPPGAERSTLRSDERTSQDRQTVRGRSTGHWTRSSVMALSIGLLLGVFGLGWSLLPPSDPSDSSPLSTGAVTPLNEAISTAELEAITLAISRAGYAQRVRVLAAADGRALLVGVLDSDEDQEAVLRAASAITRRLRLSLLSTPEFAAKVRELREQVPGELEIRPSRDAKVILTGLSDEPALIDDAIRWLRQALPEAAAIEVEALSRAEAVARFARAVRDSRLGDIDVSWNGERLLASGQIQANRLTLWERLWLSFSARYGERLQASVELRVLPDPPNPVARPAMLAPPTEASPPTVNEPTEPVPSAHARIVLPPIAAVISGPRGHIMLRDGSLILTGGVVNGFRLAAIEDAVLVFQDSLGHEYRVSR